LRLPGFYAKGQTREKWETVMTMTPDQLKIRLETLSPGTRAQVVDLTGTMDHYQAMIVSPAFEGKMMIEQHRMVFKLVQAEVDSGEVHALTLKTYTPDKAPK
jgi:stress-induced morphogen